MTATSHAILGTLIAVKFSNPYLAIPLAIASHVLADIFPHWDSGTNGRKKTKERLFKEAAVDVIAGFILSYLLVFYLFPTTNLFYVFFMILVAQSLDWLTAPYYILNIKVPPFSWFYQFSSKYNTRLDKPWGIINQVGVIVGLIILAKVL
jgi:hypothetical protein